jgi:hypothetical protein
VRSVTFTLDPTLGAHVHLVDHPGGEVVVAVPDAALIVYDAGPGHPMISVASGGPLPADLASGGGWESLGEPPAGSGDVRAPSAQESAAVFAPSAAALVERRCGDCGTVTRLDPSWRWWSCVGCNAPQQVRGA